MISHLTLKDVGPARELKFDFEPRLNVLTGDNGLGKTFVLDVLWWVLTTTWAGEKAFPWRPLPKTAIERLAEVARDETSPESTPGILALLSGREGAGESKQGIATAATWSWDTQEWLRYTPHRPHPSTVPLQVRHHVDEAADRPATLVIYARIDGSYAVFDSYYAKGGVSSFAEAAIVLSPDELWFKGKTEDDSDVAGGKRTVIAGLVTDWVSWQQREKSPEFVALRKVLHALSSPDEPLVPSEPTRVHLRDRKDIPTLATASCRSPSRRRA